MIEPWVRPGREQALTERFEQTLTTLKNERSQARPSWNRVQAGIARTWRLAIFSTHEGKLAKAYEEINQAIDAIKDAISDVRDYASGYLPQKPNLLQPTESPVLISFQLSPEIIRGHRIFPNRGNTSQVKENFRVNKKTPGRRSAYIAR